MSLISETLEQITPLEKHFFDFAQQRLDSLTKPRGSLGRLEEFAQQFVAITGQKMPLLPPKAVFTFAADHGVTEEGVSAFPREVTRQMVINFLHGGAGINVLARHAGAEVVVVDIGVDSDFECHKGLVHRKVMRGTKNFTKQPAMTKEEAVRCLEVGIELANEYAAKGFGMFGTGEMGIGNTTPSSAIVSVMADVPAAAVTGRGSGISEAMRLNKMRVIEAGIALHRPNPSDAIDVLSKLGGAEIGGIAGLIIGAAANRIPVVIDGFISTAGALIAFGLQPSVRDYLFAAHQSVEVGHTAALDKLGLTPILDLDLRLGEGTGAALAMLIIEGGLKIYREMATFVEAGVSTEA
jgi:nicotinate-nucleotide--dimethylbenzimidazole phosphoribosyltransferase